MKQLLVSLCLAPLLSHAALAGSLAPDATEASQGNLAEFLDLLALANVAAEPRDIQRNAAFLEQSFRRRGFDTRLLDNAAGRPALLARFTPGPAGAPTVLFYIHYDGQPVIPEQWAQKSPFEPVVKKRNARGEWQAVAREALLAHPLDPELRIFRALRIRRQGARS